MRNKGVSKYYRLKTGVSIIVVGATLLNGNTVYVKANAEVPISNNTQLSNEAIAERDALREQKKKLQEEIEKAKQKIYMMHYLKDKDKYIKLLDNATSEEEIKSQLQLAEQEAKRDETYYKELEAIQKEINDLEYITKEDKSHYNGLIGKSTLDEDRKLLQEARNKNKSNLIDDILNAASSIKTDLAELNKLEKAPDTDDYIVQNELWAALKERVSNTPNKILTVDLKSKDIRTLKETHRNIRCDKAYIKIESMTRQVAVIRAKYPNNDAINNLFNTSLKQFKDNNYASQDGDDLLHYLYNDAVRAFNEIKKIEQSLIEKDKKTPGTAPGIGKDTSKDNKAPEKDKNKKISGSSSERPKANIKPSERIKRIYGSDRIETSVKLSENTFEKADTVFLANSSNFADALSVSALAGANNSPILLTDGRSISPSVSKEINRLKAKKVVIVGGTSSISQDIVKALDKKIKIERIDGKDRYETSRKIAIQAQKYNMSKNVIIVDGRNYPDALSSISLVSKYNAPVLLVSDTESGMMNIEFAKKSYENKFIVGGTDSVSDKISALLGSNTKRFEGVDRYETARKVAQETIVGQPVVYVSTGENYADAIAAGPAIIKDKASLILVNQNNKSIPALKSGLYINKVNVIGGENSISKELYENLVKDIKIK